MAGLRFLERLRKMQHEKDWRNSVDVEDVLASVIDYVTKILNTRQGSTVLGDSFGIPDFTSTGVNFTSEDIPRLEREIATFVEHCEPRLCHVSVHFTPDANTPLQMIFSLNAELKFGSSGLLPVHFVTRVNPLGKVTVTQ